MSGFGYNLPDNDWARLRQILQKLGGDVNYKGYVNAENGFKDNGVAGIDTTFVDADGNTITVSGGIITAKTPP